MSEPTQHIMVFRGRNHRKGKMHHDMGLGTEDAYRRFSRLDSSRQSMYFGHWYENIKGLG